MPTEQDNARYRLMDKGAELQAALHAVQDAKASLRATVRLASALGVSQVEIARLAGISRPTVLDWLRRT